MSVVNIELPGDRRRTLERRALHLAVATAGWNSVEAVVAIASGIAAGSIGLIGFGLDAGVELLSAGVIIWQFTGRRSQDREQRALRMIAWSFFALAAYVAVHSIIDLARADSSDVSPIGMGIAALSLIVMPILARAKRAVGQEMASAAVVADSRQTSLCTYLSAVLLIGLVLNAWLGWWWADPIAGLIIAALAVSEGREAWQGEQCAACSSCVSTAPSDPAVAGDQR